jgi:hypothetical protein
MSNPLSLNTPAPTNIPVELHPDMLLAISFMDGRGAYAKQAAELARHAPRYAFRDNMHVCAFGKDIEGATRALAILDYIGQTRGCHCYTGSPMLWGTGRVAGVLRCYASALNCDQRDAWCYVIEGGALEFLAGWPIRELPCRRLVGYYYGHQAKWKDVQSELQAAAVDAGVEWCPFWRDRIRGLVKA